MAYLKYFIPIIKSLERQKEKSYFYTVESTKCSSPSNNMDILKKICNEYNVEIKKNNCIGNCSGVMIMVEGASGQILPKNLKRISMVALTDFTVLYESYVNIVDYIVFPSYFFAEYYKRISDKNVYIGSPKYDVLIEEDVVRKKYNIFSKKNVLIVFPRNIYVHKIDLNKLYNFLKDKGYNIIVKTRDKDVVSKEFRGDWYYEDYSWFPHTTMELMTLCDFVINFDSTAIEECVMMMRPLINFHIKPKKQMDFLYNYKYCRDLNIKLNLKEVDSAINYLTNNNFIEEFKISQKNHLFDKNGVADKIANFALEV